MRAWWLRRQLKIFMTALLGSIAAVALWGLAMDYWTVFRGHPVLSVIDGDTLRVNGRKVRLEGFNAPETYQARCEHERRLGLKATQALRQMVRSGKVELSWLARRDRYGRPLARARYQGRDIGEILIEQGLARPAGAKDNRHWCDKTSAVPTLP